MTTATVLHPDQVYEKLRRMIHKLIHNFQRRYGGDYDELLSEAHWHFVQACQTYNPRKKAKIITHVYNRVWYGLLGTLKPKPFVRFAPRTIHREDARLDNLPSRRVPSPFSLSRLLERVSDDARTVIKLALAVDGRGAGVRRRRLIDLLRELDCPLDVMRDSFREIREALAG